MTEAQWEDLQDRLDDIEERLRLLEINLEVDELLPQTDAFDDIIYEEDDDDILD